MAKELGDESLRQECASTVADSQGQFYYATLGQVYLEPGRNTLDSNVT